MVTFWPILLVIEARYFVEECKKKKQWLFLLMMLGIGFSTRIL
jgi:hypothetical protein